MHMFWKWFNTKCACSASETACIIWCLHSRKEIKSIITYIYVSLSPVLHMDSTIFAGIISSRE